MTPADIVTAAATFVPMAVTAAAAAAAVLPQAGPPWWIAARTLIDVLALNFGNAKNAKT